MVSVTERVKTLFLSPLQPRGGGGQGGVGGCPLPSRPPHLRPQAPVALGPAPGSWAQTLARALDVDAPRNLALLHQLISLREVLIRRF